jgi:hypothetical protein
MNSNEKILELIYSVENAGGIYSEQWQKLKNAVCENIQEETAKRNGVKKELNIIKKMLKSNQKNYNDRFLGYFNVSGRFAFLDGHRVLLSDNNFGFAEDPQNVGNFKALEQIATLPADATEEIEISLAECKRQIAENKAAKNMLKPLVINCDGFRVGVNPQFAKDAIEFTGSNKFLFEKKVNARGCNITPLYQLTGGEVATVTLPVNIN